MCVFIRPVAVAVAAWDEQHRDRSDACYKQRVMISTADHGKKVQFVLTARLRNCFDECGGTVRRSVGVQQLNLNRDLQFQPNGRSQSESRPAVWLKLLCLWPQMCGLRRRAAADP